MSLDNKINELQITFELRAEIADMMWEIDRLKEIEQAYVDEEYYEKAAIILERQKRLTRLINNKEKKAINDLFKFNYGRTSPGGIAGFPSSPSQNDIYRSLLKLILYSTAVSQICHFSYSEFKRLPVPFCNFFTWGKKAYSAKETITPPFALPSSFVIIIPVN